MHFLRGLGGLCGSFFWGEKYRTQDDYRLQFYRHKAVASLLAILKVVGLIEFDGWSIKAGFIDQYIRRIALRIFKIPNP